MVTLKDISAKCKCSVATVSKALNGMPDIGEETARHIRQVATQMGYTPNAAARTLKTNRSHTVGLLMCQRDENIWTHDFFSTVAAGIQEVMEGSGYDVTPINSLRLHTAGELLQYCVYRTVRRDHPPDGQQIRGKKDHDGGRSSGSPGKQNSGLYGGRSQKNGRGDRLSGNDQGILRRRRKGHADLQRSGGL